MRKRIGLVVLFLIGGLLLTLGATSVFAQEPVVSDGEAWEEMHLACENGDYQAMAEWHAQRHDGASGMMSGSSGMMGNGSGGMMGNW